MNLLITSFNIKNTLPNYKGYRSKDIYKLIESYDIVCLQELTPITNILLRHFMRKTHKFYGCMFGSGVFVSRKFKIKNKRKIKLFDNLVEVIKDINQYRKATFVEVEIDSDTSIKVYSCHFGFGTEWYTNYSSLQDAIRNTNRSNLLICGDFNITPDSNNYSLLKHIDNLNDLNVHNLPTFHGFNEDTKAWKVIDYALTNINYNESIFSTNYCEVSDHLRLGINLSL